MQHKNIFVFAVILLFSSIAFADYLDAYAKAVVQTNSTIYVKGYVKNSTGAGIQNVNVTAALSSFSNSSVSVSNGYFDINLTAPLAPGEYNISVSTNTSLSKTIHAYVSNTTSGYINFTGSKPPFSAGISFMINATMWNAAGGLIINYTPSVTIYKANGPAVNWTVFNTTPANNHAGYIGYNISVPADADGSYSISLDKGVITTIVLIQSTTIMAVNTQTGSNETKTNFYPGANFTIAAKIRDTSGNPIGYATNVTARVTKPDNSIDTVILNNDTTQEGRYASSAYITSSSSAGQYIIDVSAIVAGKTIKGSITASTQAMKARLERQAEFFKEWGDSAAFTAGGTVGLNIIVMNLSDDLIIGGTLTGINSVNCTSGGTNVTGLYATNGSSLSIGTVTYDAGGNYMGTAVCRITFTAPAATGNYKITFTTSVGNMNVSGAGYLEVQKYILKPNPVSSLGGAFDFAVMLYPGDNATFEVSAFDMNSQAEVAGINITNLTVTKITPLEFVGGGSDILEGGLGRSDAFNITNYTAGSNIANPTITMQLPVNRTGPFQAEVRAIINNGTTNETVTGRGFYISKYVMGFLSSFGGMMGGPPGSGGEMEGGPGGMEQGPSGGFGGGSACSGTENFRGNVMELKTNSAPKDPVTFNNILQAREEMTGKSVLPCLSMTLNSSDSNGMVQVPIMFNTSVSGCSSLTGFHFMLVNITYQGKADAVPAGFMCKRLSFQPSITDNSGNMAWKTAPSGTVNMTISSIRRINDSTTIRGGTVRIIRAFNFNPGSGMKMLAPNGTLTATLNNGSANIVLVPTSFSSSTWPNGFISITVQVTANATYNGISDSSESGFQVTAFDANAIQLNGAYNMWGQTLNAGQNISIMIEASTNVSRNNNDYTVALGANTTTGFTAKVGIPWEGKMKDVSIYRANLTSDGWNNTGHSTWPNFGKERWLINITLPANLKKGTNMIEITVNNSANEKAITDIGFTAASYSIKVGQEEGLQMENGYYSLRWGSSAASPAAILDGAGPNVQQILNKGGVGTWNLTALNLSYNLYSKSNSVCLRRGLNMTRWNEGQNAIYRYDRNGVNTAEVLLLDNTSSGNYDTVIINNTALAGSPLAILRAGQNYTSQLYLWLVDSCGYSKWINASAISSQGWSWGGSWEKNSNFTMPYIVQKGGVAVNGATVSVNAVIKQMDSTGSGSGGFGFDKKLSSSEYTVGSVNTDANGIAFVPVSISLSGSMMIFWKLVDGNVQDIASFQSKGPSSGGDSGTQVQIRSFDAYGQRVARVRGTHATASIVLYNYTSADGTIWNKALGAPGLGIYNGTYNESISGQLLQDSPNDINKTYYFLLNSTANIDLIMADTDMDFSNAQNGNKTSSYTIDSNSFGIAETRVANTTTGNVTTLAIYRDSNAWYPITSASQNISVTVCAQSFAKPAAPYPGARVYIYAESWSMNSPMATSTPLDWFDPINGTRYSFGSNGGSYSLANATTGPKGCVALDVSHPTGWPANSPVNVKAIVTYGVNTESTWVDNVWRPSQCSNMIDDDGDSKTDYRNWWGTPDDGCSSPQDDDESA